MKTGETSPERTQQPPVPARPDAAGGPVDGGGPDAVNASASRLAGALRDSEARFRALAEVAPTLIWQLDTQGNAIYLNPHYIALTGGAIADLMGAGWHAIVHPDDAPAYLAAVARAQRERSRLQQRVRVRCRRGWCWLESYAAPWFAHDGRYAGHIGIAIDITEAVQLALTQTAYRTATEGGNEGFYILHPLHAADGAAIDFEIIDSNQRGAQFLGRRREDLAGVRLSDLYRREDLARPIEFLRQALETGLYKDDVQIGGQSPLRAQWVHCRIVRSNDDLAVTLIDISQAKAHVDELERRGNEDALTGLPNRYWLDDYLPQAIERAAGSHGLLALLFIDLDGFKAVNDAAGHPVGDELLRTAARRMKVAVRPLDKIARLGGDEFVILLENIAHKRDAAHVARRVVQAFEENFTLSQGVHRVGASIGISLFPVDGANPESLLRNADIAMYAVKTGGKRGYHFFDGKCDTLRERAGKETELRRALEQHEFALVYQPRIALATGACTGLEALLRWNHPARGMLKPAEFLPAAEEAGLMAALEKFAIEKACGELACRMVAGAPPLPVAIKLSMRHFGEAAIDETIAAALARHCLDPRLIEFELRESAPGAERCALRQGIEALRRIGVRILIADFGAGGCSLSRLHWLDCDGLKPARVFTAQLGRGEKAQVLFAAITTMAHALGMRVIAAGVENEEQIRILKSLTCDEVQGVHVGPPLPSEQIERELCQAPRHPWTVRT